MATKKEREKVEAQVAAALAPGQDWEVAAVAPPVAPHLDDLRERVYRVHLPPHVRPGRKAVTLKPSEQESVTFRRGEGGVLERAMKLTPPQARQLRTEGWTVVEKE